jgi:hypothetical protein
MRNENKIIELEEVRGLKITTVAEAFKEVFSGEAFEEIKNSDYYKNRQDFLEGKKLAVQNEHGDEIDADKKIYVQENGCEKTRFYDEDGNEISLTVGFAEIEKEEAVRVTFKVTAEEKDILKKVKSKKNMSAYIKGLIREDIKKEDAKKFLQEKNDFVSDVLPEMKTEKIIAKLQAVGLSTEEGIFSTDKGNFAICVDLSVCASSFEDAKDVFFCMMIKHQLYAVRDGKFCYCQYLGQ